MYTPVNPSFYIKVRFKGVKIIQACFRDVNDLRSNDVKLSSKARLLADDTAVYLTVGGMEDGNVLQQTWTDYLCGRSGGTLSSTI